MKTWNKIKSWPLFLPVLALLLVMAVNIIHDAATGVNPLSFFMISLRNTTTNGTILYGRIIDIINRGSEV
ncbi:MAG: ABC transporter permease, partial [Lachnospiraceae bacterium]|nr:ABC transporter permease [Lachnospiraceae bacterium]